MTADPGLVAVVERIVGGDRSAVFELVEDRQLCAAVHRHYRSMANDQPLAGEELGGLVIDVALELVDRLPAWRSDGGAVPWVWAERRVRQIVARYVGIHADPIDGVDADGAFAGRSSEPDLLELLDQLADSDPEVAAWRDRLTTVASPRDQAILLEAEVQRSLGDPSPVLTAAGIYQVSPDVARQAVSRVRRRMSSAA